MNIEYTKRISGLINKSKVRTFKAKNAQHNFFDPIGLNKDTVDIFNKIKIDSENKEQLLFKALHFIKWKMGQCFKQNKNASIWMNYYYSVRNRIVSENIGLVYMLAQKKRYEQYDYDTKLSYGNEALINSADHFDPYRGYKFSTYACNAIIMAFYKINSRKTHNYTELHEKIVGEESLPFNENKEYLDELVHILNNNIAELDEREKHILYARFLCEEKVPFKDLGQTYSVSQEMIRQISKKTIVKLRDAMQIQLPSSIDYSFS